MSPDKLDPSGFAFGFDPTGCCHKREFLLKFSKDRKRWLELLLEARERFALSVFNYTVTSNHIHLLVLDNAGQDVIPRSMQLIAGRIGKEHNRRKRRNGAVWEDRYHATVVQKEEHLIQCMVYIDLNMVRAGVVEHPGEWSWSGYNEIQAPKTRYRLIDYQPLLRLLDFEDYEDFSSTYRKWIEASLMKKQSTQDTRWTQRFATGSQAFVERVKQQLGITARGRQVIAKKSGHHELKESQRGYVTRVTSVNSTNTLKWNELS